MYLQTQRFDQVGYWQAVVCSDAVLIEALRITHACLVMQCNMDSSLIGCVLDDRMTKIAAIGARWTGEHRYLYPPIMVHD